MVIMPKLNVQKCYVIPQIQLDSQGDIKKNALNLRDYALFREKMACVVSKFLVGIPDVPTYEKILQEYKNGSSAESVGPRRFF